MMNRKAKAETEASKDADVERTVEEESSETLDVIELTAKPRAEKRAAEDAELGDAAVVEFSERSFHPRRNESLDAIRNAVDELPDPASRNGHAAVAEAAPEAPVVEDAPAPEPEAPAEEAAAPEAPAEAPAPEPEPEDTRVPLADEERELLQKRVPGKIVSAFVQYETARGKVVETTLRKSDGGERTKLFVLDAQGNVRSVDEIAERADTLQPKRPPKVLDEAPTPAPGTEDAPEEKDGGKRGFLKRKKKDADAPEDAKEEKKGRKLGLLKRKKKDAAPEDAPEAPAGEDADTPTEAPGKRFGLLKRKKKDAAPEDAPAEGDATEEKKSGKLGLLKRKKKSADAEADAPADAPADAAPEEGEGKKLGFLKRKKKDAAPEDAPAEEAPEESAESGLLQRLKRKKDDAPEEVAAPEAPAEEDAPKKKRLGGLLKRKKDDADEASDAPDAADAADDAPEKGRLGRLLKRKRSDADAEDAPADASDAEAPADEGVGDGKKRRFGFGRKKK